MQSRIDKIINKSYELIRTSNEQNYKIRVLIERIICKKGNTGQLNSFLDDYKKLDDNDDTFCALALLHTIDPEQIDGKTLAYIVKNLINTEITESGPYATWIPKQGKKISSNSCDLGVNANIAFFLDMIDVHPRGLQSYIDQKIITSDYSSDYYCSESTLIYFISRWYKGNELKKLLKDCAAGQSKNGSWSNSLSDTLFRTISLLYLSKVIPIPENTIKKSINWILNTIENSTIESFPLYHELVSVSTGAYQALGSSAYTHALIVECLELYKETLPKEKHTTPTNTTDHNLSEHIVSKIHHEINNLISNLPIHIRPIMASARDAYVRNDTSYEMALLPFWIWKSLKQKFRSKIPLSTVEKLCEASVHGWISYGIFDAIIDNHLNNSTTLFAATTSDRKFHKIYSELFHDKPESSDHFTTLLSKMENAIVYETSILPYTASATTSAQPSDSQPYLNPSTIYKAWGHAIGPLTLIHLCGFTPDSHEYKSMHDFFYNYLAARTLSDDAHDWQEDMERGQHNSVGAAVAHKAGILTKTEEHHTTTSLNDLQKIFWYDILPDVSKHIQLYCQRAYMALKNSGLFEENNLPNFIIAPHELSAQNALISRKKMVDFLNAW